MLIQYVNQTFEETKKGYEKTYLERQKIQFFNKNIKTNDDLQTTKPNTKDWASRTQLQHGGELRCTRTSEVLTYFSFLIKCSYLVCSLLMDI
jgi:hypothetical protein